MEIMTAKQEKFRDEDRRKTLSRAFVDITKKWGLSRKEQALLLGWDYDLKRGTLDPILKEGKAISFDLDKLERMVDVWNIHKNLRVLFPRNTEAVYNWIRVKRDRFGGGIVL